MCDRASNGLHARRVYGLISLTDRPIPGLIPPACPEAPILGQGRDGVIQGRCGAIPLSYGSGRCGWLRSRGRIMIRSVGGDHVGGGDVG